MRVYLDTNIIMEYFGHRNLFDPVCAVIYLLGLQLKDHGLHEPAKRQQICNILKSVLFFLDVVSIDKEGLLTINTRHFKNAKGNVKILSPTEFVSQHLNAIQ